MNLSRIFAVPLWLAVLTTVGLVSALTGDGWRDAVSWLALGVPLAALAWAIHNRSR